MAGSVDLGSLVADAVHARAFLVRGARLCASLLRGLLPAWCGLPATRAFEPHHIGPFLFWCGVAAAALRRAGAGEVLGDRRGGVGLIEGARAAEGVRAADADLVHTILLRGFC